jgi:hypothetical protein
MTSIGAVTNPSRMAAVFGSAAASGGTPPIIVRTAASDIADWPCIIAANDSM